MGYEKKFLTDRAVHALYCESTGEYTMPDYNTDVKKLLLMKARAVPTGRFIDNGRVEFSGTVEYDIVYLDNENRVTGCDFTTEYDFAVPCSEDGAQDADANTRVANFSVRLLGPRRFSAKASLVSDIHISEDGEYIIDSDAFDSYEPQARESVAMVSSFGMAEDKGREYSESVCRLPSVIADEVEVLSVHAEPRIVSVNLNGGEVEFKGEVALHVLASVGSEMPIKYTKTVAINEKIDSGSLEGEMTLSPIANPGAIKCEVRAEDDGVELVCTTAIDTVIRGYKNQNITLISDCFLTNRECRNEYGDFSYTEHICTARDSFGFSSELDRTESQAEGVRNVIAAAAQPRVDSVTATGEGVTIAGEIRFTGIACEISEDGDVGYSPIRYDLPFERNVNLGCQISDDYRIEYAINTRDAGISTDGMKLYPECKVDIDISVFAPRVQSCVTACTAGEGFVDRDGAVITVYYPESCESLFDIAKRFHTSVIAIAQDNALSESVFSSLDAPIASAGIKRLIIK